MIFCATRGDPLGAITRVIEEHSALGEAEPICTAHFDGCPALDRWVSLAECTCAYVGVEFEPAGGS